MAMMAIFKREARRDKADWPPGLEAFCRVCKDESGQGGLEWLMLTIFIVGGFILVTKGLDRYQVATKIARPFNETFKRTYQYGHPKGRGYDDGGPENHPRAPGPGGNNFRIFINPGRP